MFMLMYFDFNRREDKIKWLQQSSGYKAPLALELTDHVNSLLSLRLQIIEIKAMDGRWPIRSIYNDAHTITANIAKQALEGSSTVFSAHCSWQHQSNIRGDEPLRFLVPNPCSLLNILNDIKDVKQGQLQNQTQSVIVKIDSVFGTIQGPPQ